MAPPCTTPAGWFNDPAERQAHPAVVGAHLLDHEAQQVHVQLFIAPAELGPSFGDVVGKWSEVVGAAHRRHGSRAAPNLPIHPPDPPSRSGDPKVSHRHHRSGGQTATPFMSVERDSCALSVVTTYPCASRTSAVVNSEHCETGLLQCVPPASIALSVAIGDVAETAADLDDHPGPWELEVHSSDSLAPGAVDHLTCRSRQACPPDDLEKPSLQEGIASAVEQQCAETRAAGKATSAERLGPSAQSRERGHTMVNCVVDDCLDLLGGGRTGGEVDGRPGGRGHAHTIVHEQVAGLPEQRAVNHERKRARPATARHDELDVGHLDVAETPPRGGRSAVQRRLSAE